MLADSGRFPMAWLFRPCFRGDLFLCADVLPTWYFRPAYEADCEPAMRCIGDRAVTLCADVACLAWVWWMRGQAVVSLARATDGPLLSETTSAKEAKEADGLWWKSPRLSYRGRKRIAVRTKWQSGSMDGQRHAAALKGEPPPSATRGAPRGNPTRT